MTNRMSPCLLFDPLITLVWCQECSRCKSFTTSRFRKLPVLTIPASWFYNSNPDDLVSRGVARNGLVDYWLWWTGPPLAIRNSVTVQYLTAFMKFRLKRR